MAAGFAFRTKATGLLNARLTFDVDNGISVAVFGTNSTDERCIVGGYDDASIENAPSGLGFAVVNMAPPREYA